MEKKITISVITQEANYGWEATGHGLCYIFLSAQVVLSRHIRDDYQFPQNTLLNAHVWVSQHFPLSRLSNGDRPRRSTVRLNLNLSRLISELASLKQTNWHTSSVKPKAGPDVSWGVRSLCLHFFLPSLRKHLENFSWLTAINTGWSCYLFSSGQLQSRKNTTFITPEQI